MTAIVLAIPNLRARLGCQRSNITFVAGISVLFFEYGGYWSWHFWAKWALIVGIFSVVFSYSVAKRTSWVFLPILLLSLLSSANAGGVWAFNRFLNFIDNYGGHPRMLADMQQYVLHQAALYGYITVVIVGLTLVWLPRACGKGVENLLAFICLSSVVCTLGQWSLPSYSRGAFSGNTSMNGSLIAVLLPILLLRLPTTGRAPALLLSAGAILLTQTSIPVGVLAVVAVAYLLATRAWSRRTLALGAVIVVGVMCAGALASRDLFLSSSGRFEVWGKIAQWWLANDFWWTGTGAGTGSVLIPYAQEMTGADRFGWFSFMHSEPLQILWEMGVPGLVAALLAAGAVALRAFDRPVLFAAFMGICAQSLFDYPMRLPLSCGSGVLIVWLILQKDGGSRMTSAISTSKR